MNQLPENITVAAYFNSLKFDRVETYSLLRGADFEEQLAMLRVERDALRLRHATKNDLTLGEARRFQWLDKQLDLTQYLIDDNGSFHRSSKRIASFGSSDRNCDRLKAIFNEKSIVGPVAICAPVYRDAIVFYDRQSEIVSVLNICFSCNDMEADRGVCLEADSEWFEHLKQFLRELGHEIEEQSVV